MLVVVTLHKLSHADFPDAAHEVTIFGVTGVIKVAALNVLL